MTGCEISIIGKGKMELWEVKWHVTLGDVTWKQIYFRIQWLCANIAASCICLHTTENPVHF